MLTIEKDGLGTMLAILTRLPATAPWQIFRWTATDEGVVVVAALVPIVPSGFQEADVQALTPPKTKGGPMQFIFPPVYTELRIMVHSAGLATGVESNRPLISTSLFHDCIVRRS